MTLSPALLSIVTPVKNAEPWLDECINSCFDQNFKDWEWIFIDDHSTDNSSSLIEKYAHSDSRIRIYTNPGTGIISALEAALSKSSGRYITRMDADDIMPKDRLQFMIDAINASEPKTVVTSRVQYFSETEVSPGYRQYEEWLNRINKEGLQSENLYRECVVASPNWIMRSDELNDCGGFTGLEYPEDYDLVFRWYTQGLKIRFHDFLGLLWREHPKRTSRNSDNYNQEAFFKLKLKRFLEIESNNQEVVLWGTGVKARLTAQILESSQIEFKWMALQQNKFPVGIDGHPIYDYREIETHKDPRLLIAVYPPAREMQKLFQYLSKQGLTLGQHFWFL